MEEREQRQSWEETAERHRGSQTAGDEARKGTGSPQVACLALPRDSGQAEGCRGQRFTWASVSWSLRWVSNCACLMRAVRGFKK